MKCSNECLLCKYKIPRSVMIPVKESKTGETKMLLVKEGSKLHKFYMGALRNKT